MSEAIVSSTIVIGAVSGIVRATERGCVALKDACLRSMRKLDQNTREKLEKLSATFAEQNGREQITPRYIREHTFKQVDRLLNGLPSFAPEIAPKLRNELAPLLILSESPLRHFISESSVKLLQSLDFQKTTLADIVHDAIEEMKKHQTEHIQFVLREAANACGFAEIIKEHGVKNKRYISIADTEGRAIVAELISTDDGTNMKLDLTGFGDGKCHLVLDNLVSELHKRGLQLRNVSRRSHYRRRGLSLEWQQPLRKSGKQPPAHQTNIQKEGISRRRRVIDNLKQQRFTAR